MIIPMFIIFNRAVRPGLNFEETRIFLIDELKQTQFILVLTICRLFPGLQTKLCKLVIHL